MYIQYFFLLNYEIYFNNICDLHKLLTKFTQTNGICFAHQGSVLAPHKNLPVLLCISNIWTFCQRLEGRNTTLLLFQNTSFFTPCWIRAPQEDSVTLKMERTEGSGWSAFANTLSSSVISLHLSIPRDRHSRKMWKSFHMPGSVRGTGNSEFLKKVPVPFEFTLWRRWWGCYSPR